MNPHAPYGSSIQTMDDPYKKAQEQQMTEAVRKVKPVLREELLEEARTIVVGGRDKQYSGPEHSFTVIAGLWSVMFDREFTPEEVAMALAALKLARLKTGGTKQRDTWVDIAGYAACGFEVSERTRSES